MNCRSLHILLTILVSISSIGQNKIDLRAYFDVENKQIRLTQRIEYENISNDTLKSIYLNDWSNSYSTKSTPLAKRFSEEFSNKFHFAKNEQRGFTVVTSLKNDKNSELQFSRLSNQLDIIKVELQDPIGPNESYIISLNYIVQVPSDAFTRFGVTNNFDFKLKNWYITPAVYDGKWNYYSNKDLDDLYVPKATLNFEIEYPRNYLLISELDVVDLKLNRVSQVMTLHGENRIDTKLFLTRLPSFKIVDTDFLTLESNIEDEGLAAIDKAIISDRVVKFLNDNLGKYPHKKLLLTNVEYRKDPIYGLNLLPDFIRPFPDHFQYELKLLKTALRNYLNNTLQINPRKDYWLPDGLQTYFLMKYVDEFYPKIKLMGSLAKIWGLRSFHAADLEFNDQYAFMYMNMARPNLDQPLTMQKDSLLKFNKNIASKYKAGIGLRYLSDYLNDSIVHTTIKEYLVKNKLKPSSPKDFEILLKSRTSKNIDWFFKDYLTTSKKIDFKIIDIHEADDSLKVTVKNKRKSNVPISLFAMQKDSVLYRTWINDVSDKSTITIPKNDADRLVLNENQLIPEFNLRNNTKSLTKSLFNKPPQVRLFKDVEDPDYNQIFLMPLVEYKNIYDGLRLGMKAYNKTILKKQFIYKFTPQYSTNSRSLTGSALVQYDQYLENKKRLYRIYYGLGAKYSSYAEDLFVTVFTPNLSFYFRDNSDLRLNKREILNFRYVNIDRDEDINNISDVTDPNYRVFNIRYVNSNPGLVDFSRWFADFQVSQTFSKISLNYEFRRLFKSNRQLNIRFFAGTFLRNKNDPSSDYFSFALDRPTDYLFDFNYLGRSEDTGIFSQQIIIAEGGFKSKLDTPFANQWLSTLNLSTSIWNYIQAYGDIGLVKNKNQSAKFVYDSGIRINLVQDYFEIYFPVYSNLGWEIAQPQYSQKIRFVFTADPKTLFSLFTRRWY
ncbi:MAG: metalloprotease [Flavobacteriaceae bacterium]|nr:metalloprotease [Flavobacteriaceae bacterium]